MQDAFDVLKFLEDYRRFPCLWLKSDPEFKLRQKRESAENILLANSGLGTVENLRRKMRSIRCTYNQEVAKISKSKSTGTGNVYVPKLMWFAYADSFLKKNYDDERQPEIDLDSVPLENVETLFYPKDENIEEPQIIEIKASTCESNNLNDINKSSNIPQSTKRIKTICRQTTNKKTKIENLDSAIENIKSILKIKPKNNEFEIFGNLVAAYLEKLPSDQALVMQEEIHSMLTRARSSVLSRPIKPELNKLS